MSNSSYTSPKHNAGAVSSMLNSKRNATKFKQTDKKYFFGQKHLGATTVKVDIFLFNSALANLRGAVEKKNIAVRNVFKADARPSLS
ncbi:MAG: hypothetical protein SFV55_15015 [Haliscomenobacter sp.]|uniref:hypothetical protein n=1 Tax=Haliscomenobacter sp. TaxID=2717303 RepID=UPI0029B2DAE0|nr:hypothetical protein [Haliscomenobacter sp.]MDX2069737.1 hypothetical protein [Haliscomenobacter sp.]